ncbi:MULTISPECIES: hypothetical protein [Methylobacterium]|uniref:Proteophosphoglycan ppg4 n=1 Tax=Methylobacterium bullatum TaxID=570505 RepID=A0A679K6T0_9HYPH|nr:MULTISPECIES: hypothetical protein [Methylobacterium]KQO46102.1 hypothetical protein ASF08_06680 [Methylobacterium sp. Leaf85]KQP05416.1 hypothetical protein ASF26_08205 [Methylobacterium sp. Leaf93]MBD8900783.1 hypothetical protein [Methylobacterium bullatum]TXN31694.1 hypothetical protein FV220_05915 [Methylobacterium sp. WL19]CAA2139730.1 hypothetical protein MBLL_01764 [Methylobacterium bullatum]
MTAIKISTAAAALVVALSGAAFAQTGMPESHGTNAAGSKSGVVGKGDSMEAGPATTGTATAPGARTAPGSAMPSTPGMTTNDPSAAPRPVSPAPAVR